MIRMLIVDDESATRRIIKAFLDLDEIGLELLGEAEDGAEALEFFEMEDKPQLVITDMNMPVLDGISFTKYMADRYPEVKIIVISGYFDYEYTRAAVKNGAIDYILKPIDENELLEAVQKCVRAINKDNAEHYVPDEIDQLHDIDIEVYQEIINQSRYVDSALENLQKDFIFELLEGLQTKISEKTDGKGAAKLACKVWYEKLLYYCINQKAVVPDLEYPNPDMDSMSGSDVTVHYFKFLKEIYAAYFDMQIDLRQGEGTIQAIKKYVDNHYRENLRVDEIAARFFISKEYLSTAFRNQYGTTISNYIIERKMTNAMKQLEYGARSVKDIAFNVGYEDVGYFSRVFKKFTGVSPARFRECLK